MDKTQPPKNLLLFVLAAYSPILLGYFLLSTGFALNISILLLSLDGQLFMYLLYLAGLIVVPVLFILGTYRLWTKTSDWLWRSASLYIGVTLQAGLLLFILMGNLAGMSMAVSDGGVTDVSGAAARESMLWLAYSQVCIIPWVIGAVILLRKNLSK